jgi:hypothetical protein
MCKKGQKNYSSITIVQTNPWNGYAYKFYKMCFELQGIGGEREGDSMDNFNAKLQGIGGERDGDFTDNFNAKLQPHFFSLMQFMMILGSFSYASSPTH